MDATKKRTLELYFFRRNGGHFVTNKMPVLDEEEPHLGWLAPVEGSVDMGLCDEGLRVFGIRSLKDSQLFRLRLLVESVEVGEVKVDCDLKPFAPVPRRKKPAKK